MKDDFEKKIESLLREAGEEFRRAPTSIDKDALIRRAVLAPEPDSLGRRLWEKVRAIGMAPGLAAACVLLILGVFALRGSPGEDAFVEERVQLAAASQPRKRALVEAESAANLRLAELREEELYDAEFLDGEADELADEEGEVEDDVMLTYAEFNEGLHDLEDGFVTFSSDYVSLMMGAESDTEDFDDDFRA